MTIIDKGTGVSSIGRTTLSKQYCRDYGKMTFGRRFDRSVLLTSISDFTIIVIFL